MSTLITKDLPQSTAHRLENPTGANIVAGEFTIFNDMCLWALDDVDDGDTGPFEDLRGTVIQISDFNTGEATFAAANTAVYWDPTAKKFSSESTAANYRVGYSTAAKDSAGVLTVKISDPVLIPSDYATIDAALTAEIAARAAEDTRIEAGIVDGGGRPFHKTVTLTAAAAATPVNIVTEAELDTGEVVFIQGFLLSVGGATAWADATATIVTLQDTAGTPVVAATAAKAQLTGNAQLGPLSTGITLGTPIRTGVGLTAEKGLDVAGDANFGAGSDLSVTVFGVIAVPA